MSESKASCRAEDLVGLKDVGIDLDLSMQIKMSSNEEKKREEKIIRHRLADKRYRERHPELVKANQRRADQRYRERHPERVKAKQKRFRETHQESEKARHAKNR